MAKPGAFGMPRPTPPAAVEAWIVEIRAEMQEHFASQPPEPEPGPRLYAPIDGMIRSLAQQDAAKTEAQASGPQSWRGGQTMTPPKFPCATYAAKLPPERRDQFARFSHWAEWEDLDAFLWSQVVR